MGLKNKPLPLYKLALQTVSKSLLHQWENTYHTSYSTYVKELKSIIGVLIPYTVYDHIFEMMVNFHVRNVKNGHGNYYTDHLSVASLIGSIINSNQHNLCLGFLRHIGIVLDDEIIHLESVILYELPTLGNLETICLQTSGRDNTLPTCSERILDGIGKWCPKLKSLDISYNHTVTDTGLKCLLPSVSRSGCASLVKLSLFECSVTEEGVANVLRGLPKLKFLGYRETGQSLLHLSKIDSSGSINKLELLHINNLGVISRTCKDVGKLRCNENLINAMSTFCTKLNGLKVRISDSDVPLLKKIDTITILELLYNLGTPDSPRNGTIQFLNICGAQFISLAFVCNTFSTKLLKVVCEQCNNLKRLSISCNNFNCDQDITSSDKRKCTLFNFECLFFKVGFLSFDEARIPTSVMNYILHKTNVLREVTLAMNNSLFCDSFVEDLFSSIQTVKLQEINILVPNKNMSASFVNLTLLSVENLIGMCPKLKRLGNLLVWNISIEEIQDLRRQLRLTNSALVVIWELSTI